MKKIIFALLIGLPVVVLPSSESRALTVYCTNCSETWTQSVERVTNIEQLQTLINQYNENITQTEQQIALVANNIKQYENMLQNTKTLPQELLNLLNVALGNLARDSMQLNLQKGDYLALGQLFDDIYPSLDIIKNLVGGNGDISVNDLWERWSREADRSAQATFQVSGMQLQDLAQNSDALNEHIAKLLNTPEGQMEAITAGNQLASIQIAEAQKLRALMATSIQGTAQAVSKEEKKEQLAEENWKQFTSRNPIFDSQFN
jgi:P-type conjugative transfer protein TrbJ